MSDGVRIELESVPDADAIARRVQDAVEKCMAHYAENAMRHAQAIVPHRTGKLKESIMSSTVTSGTKVTAILSANAYSRGSEGTGESYAPFVEFGTGQKGMAGGATYAGITDSSIEYNASWPGMTAQPYLRPAMYDNIPELVEDLKRSIAEVSK